MLNCTSPLLMAPGRVKGRKGFSFKGSLTSSSEYMVNTNWTFLGDGEVGVIGVNDVKRPNNQ